MKTKLGVGIVWGALCVFACSEAPVDIGDENTRKTGENLSDYEGSWSGYAEAFTFQAAGNSDRVRILLDEQGNGTLQVGEGAASVPAVDPDVAPPGPWTGGAQPPRALIGGYRYTLKELHVEERRLRFTLDPFEPIQPWCRAQAPVPTMYEDGSPTGEAFCRVNVTADLRSGVCMQWDATNQSSVLIDCGAYNLCYHYPDACRCNLDSCDTTFSWNWTSFHYTGDVVLTEDGTEVVGTLVVKERDVDGRPVQIRLSR